MPTHAAPQLAAENGQQAPESGSNSGNGVRRAASFGRRQRRRRGSGDGAEDAVRAGGPARDRAQASSTAYNISLEDMLKAEVLRRANSFGRRSRRGRKGGVGNKADEAPVSGPTGVVAQS